MAKKDVIALIEQTKEFIYADSVPNDIRQECKKCAEMIAQKKLAFAVTPEEYEQIKSLVADKQKYTFYKGEEQDFLDFIIDYDKEYGNRTDEQANCIVCFVVVNSLNYLDINKLFECLDKGQSFGDNSIINSVRGFVFGNIIGTSALSGDINKIMELITRDDVSLCDIKKYEMLRVNGEYPEELGYPQDLITCRVPNPNFAHGNLLELLFNSKVKMINVKVIYKAMIGGFLNSIELKELFDHIYGNDIIVYDSIDGKVTAIDDPYKYLYEMKPDQK